MIPKKIHYIWLGNGIKDKLSEICLLSWKEKMPDYELIEWNEKNLDLDKIAKENEFFAECKKRKLYAFMADYLRIKILYEQGGIYIDTDVQAIKRLDDLLDRKILLGYEGYTKTTVNESIGTGFIGAEKNNEFIGKVFEFYNTKIMSSPQYKIPNIMTEVYESLSDEEKNEINILPYEYFAPYDYREIFDRSFITKNTYAIHWFSGSWCENKWIRKFLKVKHVKNPIKRQFAIIERSIDYYKKQYLKKRDYKRKAKEKQKIN